MRAQLLHLSGPQKGRTITYDGSSLLVGSAAGCDVRLASSKVVPRHAMLEFVEAECAFHLRSLDGHVFVNQQEIAEVILAEGDLIEWGIDGPKTRFRIWCEPGRTCKPVRRMFRDAREVAQVSGGGAATGTLVRDLLTQATPQLKIGVPMMLALLALPLAFLAGWLGTRSLASKVQTADEFTHKELEQLRADQLAQRAELEHMAAASRLVRQVQDEWTRGVCLIYGSFGLRRADSTPLLDGSGQRLQIEYTGSGFLASKTGDVITNRHVVVPWDEIEAVQPLLAGGFTPEFLVFSATFPGLLPIAIDPKGIQRRADKIDVAVLRLPAEAVRDVPVLPLHQDSLDDLTELNAIVVGYPTGLGALLARADPELVERLRTAGADMSAVIDALARAGSITPLVTAGIFSQSRANPTMLTYDASTTHGGSGGPVFGADGSVIAVNFAILEGFSGANFGVPIRYARELLTQ